MSVENFLTGFLFKQILIFANLPTDIFFSTEFWGVKAALKKIGPFDET